MLPRSVARQLKPALLPRAIHAFAEPRSCGILQKCQVRADDAGLCAVVGICQTAQIDLHFLKRTLQMCSFLVNADPRFFNFDLGTLEPHSSTGGQPSAGNHTPDLVLANFNAIRRYSLLGRLPVFSSMMGSVPHGCI